MANLINNPYYGKTARANAFNISSLQCNASLNSSGSLHLAQPHLIIDSGDELIVNGVSIHEGPLFRFMLDHILTQDQIEKMVSYLPAAIKWIDNPSIALQRQAVLLKPSAIQFIKQPAKEIQLLVVEANADNIQYIERPDVETQLRAVQKTPTSIVHIEHPSSLVQMLVGIKYIDLIKNPCHELQMEAVKKDKHYIYRWNETYQDVLDLHNMLWEI